MRTTLLLTLLGALGATLLAPWATVQTAAPPRPNPHRSPIDLALLPDGRRAVTANHTADSVSLVDLAAGTVLAEVPAGQKPAAVACSRDGKRVAVTNLWSGTVSLFSVTDSSLTPLATVEIGSLPRGVAFGADGSLFIAVSGTDEVVQLDIANRKILSRWSAPREPYSLAISADGKLLACASSRSGEVRLWETASGKERWTRKIVDAFNLRGLAFSPDGQHVVCAHLVRRDFPVSRENVERGWVIDNRLSRLFITPPVAGPVMEQLSLDPRGQAAGDPHGLAFSADGAALAVAVAGTQELFVFQSKALAWSAAEPADFIDADLLCGDGRFRRHMLGGRPLAVAWRGSGEVVLANYQQDAVQIVHPTTGKVSQTIHLGGPREQSLVRLGETLFHDARRAHNHWFSCHSCHPDGHTASQNFDTLNDDNFGDPKLTPTLRGVGRTAPYTWHGWQKSLAASVRKSFIDTLHGKDPAEREVQAVVAYLNSLDHPAVPSRSKGKLTLAAQRGQDLFEGKARCARCHEAPTYTTPRNYDVKLQHDGSPYEGWNPPSLLGLWDRGPFMHDGRSTMLEDVLTRWHNPDRVGGAKLTPAERADLIAFLKSL